jgi:hypothetical protein
MVNLTNKDLGESNNDVFIITVSSVDDKSNEFLTFVNGTDELAFFLTHYDRDLYDFVGVEMFCPCNKMFWNYRIVKRVYEGKLWQGKKTEDDIEYGIYEAYYDDNESEPHSITERPVIVIGETLEELHESYRKFGEAFNKSILNWEDF